MIFMSGQAGVLWWTIFACIQLCTQRFSAALSPRIRFRCFRIYLVIIITTIQAVVFIAIFRCTITHIVCWTLCNLIWSHIFYFVFVRFNFDGSRPTNIDWLVSLGEVVEIVSAYRFFNTVSSFVSFAICSWSLSPSAMAMFPLKTSMSCVIESFGSDSLDIFRFLCFVNETIFCFPPIILCAILCTSNSSSVRNLAPHTRQFKLRDWPHLDSLCSLLTREKQRLEISEKIHPNRILFSPQITFLLETCTTIGANCITSILSRMFFLQMSQERQFTAHQRIIFAQQTLKNLHRKQNANVFFLYVHSWIFKISDFMNVLLVPVTISISQKFLLAYRTNIAARQFMAPLVLVQLSGPIKNVSTYLRIFFFWVSRFDEKIQSPLSTYTYSTCEF